MFEISRGVLEIFSILLSSVAMFCVPCQQLERGLLLDMFSVINVFRVFFKLLYLVLHGLKRELDRVKKAFHNKL